MIKFKEVRVIDVYDWDELVRKTYGKPYEFQQQDGCKERGMHDITVPMVYPEDFECTEIPVEINGEVMGVSFAAWLEKDPKDLWEFPPYGKDKWSNDLFWRRNFYPCVDMIVNDLHSRGVLPEGDYIINIDW